MENKGDCYTVAYKEQEKSNQYVLVHGLVQGQGKLKGIKYNHAWVEDTKNDIVIDRTIQSKNLQEMPKIAYYALGQIQENEVFRYTFIEKIEKSSKFETYGPWEARLLTNKF